MKTPYIVQTAAMHKGMASLWRRFKCNPKHSGETAADGCMLPTRVVNCDSVRGTTRRFPCWKIW